MSFTEKGTNGLWFANPWSKHKKIIEKMLVQINLRVCCIYKYTFANSEKNWRCSSSV